MDSKSIRRVAASFGVIANYDASSKTWSIGGQILSSAEAASMSAKDLRSRLDKTSDTGGETAKASSILKRANTGKSVSVQANKPKRKSKDDSDSVASVQIMFPNPKVQKRFPEGTENMIWLPGVGISKWQLRQKLEARGNQQAADELGAERTQFYSKARCKQIAKLMFDSVDRKILAAPDEYSKHAVKVAQDARDGAEVLLAAAQ